MNEFELLLQKDLASLQRYVNFKISNRQDAEDIIQEVCLAATVKFHTLKDKSVFKAWLIGIANHKCNDYYRRKAKDNGNSDVRGNETPTFLKPRESKNIFLQSTILVYSPYTEQLYV